MPTDGIVKETALKITKGEGTDVQKAHAIYEWVVESTERNPKTRGCGVGDIKAMLETGTLNGKCADLNALFVALSARLGIPARDVYGIRVAASPRGYKSMGRPATSPRPTLPRRVLRAGHRLGPGRPGRCAQGHSRGGAWPDSRG